ncbi:YciI family protein [Pseudonocardia sp. WMMC193]|uniref:YciI family protein n=1 Tax=Pseudonocardia sp. WMMC193 TaxID=2911965 RepID=UPI001F3151CE|nr:YciI family protein [Pseudonocardia sp. WMMC193]MCF7547730.1 YciI family protein [Pseudonocardia sp. WMMC193]
MSTFAVIYTYTDDTDTRMQARPKHRDYLAALPELVVAGAWSPSEPAGGLLIFRAADKSAVQKLLDADPYAEAGVIANVEIREWVPPLGPAAAAITQE